MLYGESYTSMNQHFIQTVYCSYLKEVFCMSLIICVIIIPTSHTWRDVGKCRQGCVQLTSVLLASLLLVLLCTASEPRACSAIQELCNAALSSVLGSQHLYSNAFILNQKNSLFVAVYLMQNSQVKVRFSGIFLLRTVAFWCICFIPFIPFIQRFIHFFIYIQR